MLLPFHDTNPIHRTPWVTYGIVGLNVLVFLGFLGLSPPEEQLVAYHRGFVPARIGQLVHGRPLEVRIEQVAVRPWDGRQVQVVRPLVLEPRPGQVVLSLVTCMFLHGGWMHLVGNMWFLWLFGNNCEDRLGPSVFLFFYLAGGFVASACHWLTDPASTVPVIGASGAVAAILGGYAITWPTARVHTLVFLFFFVTVVDLPALLVLGVWFLGQLIEAQRAMRDLGGLGGGVAWWAHVGGFVAGLAMMPALGILAGAGPPPPRRRPPRRDLIEELFE